MNIKKSPFDKALIALTDLNSSQSQSDKLKILNDFYNDAAKNGAVGIEEYFKSKSRQYVSLLVTIWFYVANFAVLIFIGAISFVEWKDGSLGKGIINTTVLITLISASVVQNATAFIIFAKYAFNIRSSDSQVSEKK